MHEVIQAKKTPHNASISGQRRTRPNPRTEFNRASFDQQMAATSY
ncbi:hypothetical protein [Edaphobacter modestus]|nr:hypothetical protein [Edaphobacter modestus]